MINLERPVQAETLAFASAQGGLPSNEFDQQIQRIERIGKRLFNTAGCFVGLLGAKSVSSSIASREAEFCRSIPWSTEPVVMPDIREDALASRHRAVTGAPWIRFYAAHPVYESDRALAGNISLIDYAPRSFREEDWRMLSDLANLVERELQLRSMNASQLDLQRKNKNLRRRSLIDPLVGTWNRGAIMRILAIEALRCAKESVPLSLIVADLDYFKKINDTHGHPAGDEVLVKVASRLRSCIRPQEALGRYGGEEFLIVLPGTSTATAMTVAERMRQAIAAKPEHIDGTSLNLTISAGVASTDMFPVATIDELISRADVALYAAKGAGRNRVMQATPDLS